MNVAIPDLPRNFVDLAIVAVLVGYALAGLRRGLIAGVTDLAGMGVAFLFAAKFYGIAATWLANVVTIPQILVNFIALVGLFILGQILFGLVVGPLLSLVYRFLLPGPLRLLDALAGTVPGLVKGVIVVSALAALFALFPLNTPLAQAIRDSALGAKLSDGVATAVPQLEALAGNSPYRTALFVTQPADSEAPRQLNFPSGLSLHYDLQSEQRMLDLVNAERTKNGLGALVLDPRLREVARAHSEDMFRRGYFAHDSPDGETPAARVQKANIPFLAMGENLAYAPGTDIAHQGLMNSPGHRRNILSPSFGHVGIGVVDGGLFGEMFSQEFTN